jgi:PKD repeat protein
MVKQVYIKPAPPVEYTYTVACLNSPVTFGPDTTIINISTIGSWYWDFGDGITIQRYVYGAYLQCSRQLPCGPGDRRYSWLPQFDNAHIIPINPLPLAHFDAGTLNCSVCHRPVQHELSSTYVGYIVQWDWNFGDGTTQTVLPSVESECDPHLCIERDLPSDPDSSCIRQLQQFRNAALNIYPKPEANFDYGSTCDGMAVPFTDLSQGNGGGSLTQWIWDFGDPTTGVANGSTLQSPSHMFSGTGTYTVRLIVMTSNSCTRYGYPTGHHSR